MGTTPYPSAGSPIQASRQPPAMSGDQVQCSDLGLHDGEMSAIDRCEVTHAQTLCCCDDGCVDGSEWKVAILGHQLGDGPA